MKNLKIIAHFRNENMRRDFTQEVVKWENRCEITNEAGLSVTYEFTAYTSYEEKCLLRTFDALHADQILEDYEIVFGPYELIEQ